MTKLSMAEQTDSIKAHDGQAAEYDDSRGEYRWYGPEAVFGMCFEYVEPGETILDIGTGTGLAAAPFARAGREAYCLDGSAEMLEVCRKKGFSRELKQFDLNSGPLPYDDGFFENVITCGVLNFFEDLDRLFGEIARVTGQGGIFGFTIGEGPNDPQTRNAMKKENIMENGSDKYTSIDVEGTTMIFHNESYVNKLLLMNGFELLKDFRFLVQSGSDRIGEMICRALVVRKV